jgi:hypothetical protein
LPGNARDNTGIQTHKNSIAKMPIVLLLRKTAGLIGDAEIGIMPPEFFFNHPARLDNVFIPETLE